MTVKKNKQTPAPPTVLVITLEVDGSGSLLARRGELAHLSQFTYQGLAEIVAAIQSGAEALIAIEQNPPVLDAPPAQAETSTPSEDDTEAADSEDELPTKQAAEPVQAATSALSDPLAVQPELQPKLI